MKHPFDEAGIEPSIDEMLADPIVRLVMRRDRVADETVWEVLADAEARFKTPFLSLVSECCLSEFSSVPRCRDGLMRCA